MPIQLQTDRHDDSIRPGLVQKLYNLSACIACRIKYEVISMLINKYSYITGHPTHSLLLHKFAFCIFCTGEHLCAVIIFRLEAEFQARMIHRGQFA